jgi:hypothetical protein
MNMPTLLHYATVELLGELEIRGYKTGNYCSISNTIDTLAKAGCPQTIIDELMAWEREPVADSWKLRKWIEACHPSGEKQ